MTSSYSNNPPTPPHSCKGYRVLHTAFWSAITVLLVFYVFRPISDLDFWWHLKTGDVMLQQKSLLRIDPFNYTGDVTVKGREAVILNGYWLWQIIASALYSAWGFNGIFLLKFVTAGLMSWAVLFEMGRQSLSQVTRIVFFTLGSLLIINVYNLERPQVYSIFFITLLVGMISRIRIGHAPSCLLFPMMIIWANIHGGFIVGDIILGLAAAGFLIQYRSDRKSCLKLIGWAAAGVLVSFINPNGWNAFIESFSLMQNAIGPSHVSEYRSSWQMYLTLSKMSALILWALSALHLAGLLLAPRRFWPEIFVSLFIIAFGLKFIRNSGFIAFSLLPMTGWYVEQAYARFNKTLPGYARAAICVLFLGLVSWFTLGEWKSSRTSAGPIVGSFPVNMANFLKSSGLQGNLFNEYGSGGFLDWALYPQWKTFIDGRELDTRVSGQYLKIAFGSMDLVEGKPRYELLLDRYQIDVIAMKIALANGQLQPLLKLLFNQPQWIPVFLDGQSFVIVRNTPNNATPLQRLKLDKTYFLDELTRMIGQEAKGSTNDIRPLILYADALIYSGRLNEAENILKKLESRNLNPEMMIYFRNQYNLRKQ
jgi:hypothetical protein